MDKFNKCLVCNKPAFSNSFYCLEHYKDWSALDDITYNKMDKIWRNLDMK